MAWGSKSGDMPSTSARGGALSFIGAEVTITGNIGGNGDIHLDGTIEGDLTCNALILGPGGRIRGNITASTALSMRVRSPSKRRHGSRAIWPMKACRSKPARRSTGG
jgi:hypothetical protein